MDESQNVIGERLIDDDSEIVVREPVYFANVNTLPYMSIGIKVAPDLDVDSEYSYPNKALQA